MTNFFNQFFSVYLLDGEEVDVLIVVEKISSTSLSNTWMVCFKQKTRAEVLVRYKSLSLHFSLGL